MCTSPMSYWLIIIPCTLFCRPCGVVLMLIYVAFIVVAVLYESGVIPVNF